MQKQFDEAEKKVAKEQEKTQPKKKSPGKNN